MEEFNDNGRNERNFFKIIKNIGDIKPEDSLIQVIGTARKVNPSMEFLLTDETGEIPVREIPDEIQSIDEGKLYRVFGRVSIDGVGTQYLQAEMVVKLEDDFRLDLFKKSIELYEKIE